MIAETGAVAIAKRFIAAIETRDFDAAIAFLANDVRQSFPFSAAGSESHGPIFDGKDEVEYYVRSLAGKFSYLIWEDPDWTASADGARAFLEARGKAVVAHSGKAYRNTYITRFDVRNSLIVEFREYTNMDTYIGLEIPPTDKNMKAFQRGLTVASH